MIKTFILDAVNEIDAILGIKAFILNIVTKIDSFFGWGVLKSIYKATIEQNRWFLYIEGIINTLMIAIVAALIGVVVGVTLSMIVFLNKKTGKLKPFAWIANTYITIIRGTPVVLQLMILYFVVFATWDNGILIGAITFGINSSAYVAESIRAGFESVDDGQREAGRSLGLNTWQTMFHIIIPQALKNSLPPLFNEFITLVKETAIVGYVGIMDLGKIPGLIQSRTFEYLPPLIIAAMLYLVVVMILTLVLRLIEKKLAKSDRNGGKK
jgi:polar amino acid transport system permease protein/polar amino acid transport system substrate-binding protein